MPKVKERGVLFDVVGLDYRMPRAVQKIIAEMVEDQPLNAELQREPFNPSDKNAIKVVLNDQRAKPYFKNEHIGYIRRTTAAVVAPGMDNGRLEVKRCLLEYVNYDHGWGRVRVAFLKTRANKPKFRA